MRRRAKHARAGKHDARERRAGWPKLETRQLIGEEDGEQSREFTYVSDAVDALLRAADKGRPGEVYNVGGGSRATVNEATALLEAIGGKTVTVRHTGGIAGDARRTAADITKACEELGYAPSVALRDGLEREYRWLEALVATEGSASG